ncbi:plasmid mobilization protein [uncultured Oscillibacter sp.]|uniref:plasmid mobilization protein n=1 Tax=uncultured Oscillibacter sp. TaxID=876091 RepID=UPI0025E78253|nr:plasmid mobilization relaxosome protein MobC [uncultured Oscillibacter sp.]
MTGKKRRRNIPLYVWLSPEEQQAIKDRMEQTGIHNMSAYVRKMALNGYVLQVDLSPVRELVSLQRRCANNLNQAALHVNTYGGLYPNELQALQKDYADLWGPLSELLEKLAQVVAL